MDCSAAPLWRHFCELQWWILHVFHQTLFLLCLKSDFSESKQCSTDLDDNLGGFIYIYLYIMNDSFLLVLIFAWSSLWLTNHPVNLYCVEHILCSVFSLQPYIQFSEMIMQLKKKILPVFSKWISSSFSFTFPKIFLKNKTFFFVRHNLTCMLFDRPTATLWSDRIFIFLSFCAIVKENLECIFLDPVQITDQTEFLCTLFSASACLLGSCGRWCVQKK